MDKFEPTVRSRIMRLVKSRDTKPELKVRKACFRLGYRYRLHHKGLPGTPDLVFPKLRTVLFVHGCFWHSHSGCAKSKLPETNREFWSAKLQRNVLRDVNVRSELIELGWNVLVVWECETRSPQGLEARLHQLLPQMPPRH